MLTILRNSVIYFDKTCSFATRSWQCWENIDLRVPIPLLKEARNLQKNLQDIASMVYIETDDYDFNQLNIKPKPIDLDIDNYKEHDAFFSEIKDTIIQGIRNAKYLIWCAVAWITDDDIYNELHQKRNNGIQIRILTSDEPSNSRLLKNLCDNFEVVKIPQWGENSRNRMHDKFCIIDLEYVMHGSYNWSRNAMSNNETLATALDKDFVKKFADEFMFLYNAHKHDQKEDTHMDTIYTTELVALGASLAELAVKGTATAVSTKIKAIRDEKNTDKVRNTYDEIVSELLLERDEAIRIAQSYKSELEKVVISDEDIQHLHNTVSNILEIIKSIQIANALPKGEDEIAKVKSQVESYEQIKELISVDTLKTMQLLGFNYKAAIGEPLTEICANAISKLGNKTTVSKRK